MREALGRGLQSLIPNKKKEIKKTFLETSFGKKMPTVKESVFNVEIDKIKTNPFQPRKTMLKDSLKELAASIREHGVLQPLIVTKLEKTTESGRGVEYELVAGERRLRASKIARLPRVPVIIRGTADDRKLQVALVENVQRENLNPIETALAYRQLQDRFGLKQSEIAEKVGKDRVTISNALRILTLPEEVLDALTKGKITEGHGRAILMARPDARIILLKEILKNGWSVRQTEERARKLLLPIASRAPQRGPKSSIFRSLEQDLEKTIGRRTSITQRGDVGHLRIEFASKKELDVLVKYLLMFKK